MPQFALYRNRNPATRSRYPLLLDIQSDLLDALATRVVIPLAVVSAARSRLMETLTPTLRFEGKQYVMLTPQLAGVATRDLGPVVGDLKSERDTLIAAIDLLITGI
jgi:toxin CcdB